MTKHIACNDIYDQLGLPDAPLIIDVRSDSECNRSQRMIPGAFKYAASEVQQWARKLPRTRAISIYGTDDVSCETAAIALVTLGYPAAVLTGGFDAWLNAGHPTVKTRQEYRVPGGSQWVTRERPKIDRLACPWLVRRFIDPGASFFYVPAHRVRTEAVALGAEPFDIADVTFSHRGPRCSFDAFLEEFELHDSVIDVLANIVRAADTGALALAPEAPGLLAISLGLSATIGDDILLLEHAMPIYDALYAWCKTARDETHSWPQKKAMK
jgi:rhodanese-related sulfurtransferase